MRSSTTPPVKATHANAAVQKQAVDEGDVAREDLQSGFEQLEGRHLKWLLNFDGPHRPVAQLVHLITGGDAHNVFHGANVRQTILNERRDRLIGIP